MCSSRWLHHTNTESPLAPRSYSRDAPLIRNTCQQRLDHRASHARTSLPVPLTLPHLRCCRVHRCALPAAPQTPLCSTARLRVASHYTLREQTHARGRARARDSTFAVGSATARLSTRLFVNTGRLARHKCLCPRITLAASLPQV